MYHPQHVYITGSPYAEDCFLHNYYYNKNAFLCVQYKTFCFPYKLQLE